MCYKKVAFLLSHEKHPVELKFLWFIFLQHSRLAYRSTRFMATSITPVAT